MTSTRTDGPSLAVVDGVDVDAVHEAIAACPAIAGVGSSLPGAVATYLPGRRVLGVRVSGDLVELEVCTRWGVPAAEVAAQIRSALRSLVAGRRIDVAFIDIELPESEPA